MRALKPRPLFFRIFVSVSAVVVVFQAFLTVYMARNFNAAYLKDTLERTRLLMNSAVERLENAFLSMTTTAYSLIYCDTAQDFMALTSRNTDAEVMQVQEAMYSLFSAAQSQKPAGVDYILSGLGNRFGSYSTVKSSGIHTGCFDFQTESWYQEFAAQGDSFSQAYFNVLVPDYPSPDLPEEPVNLLIFRGNALHNTRKINGYLIMIFTDRLFEDLLNNLDGFARDIVIVDGEGNSLYERLTTMDRAGLLSMAQEEPRDIRRSEDGTASFVPMSISIEDMGWRLYCAVDVTTAQAALRSSNITWAVVSCVLLILLLALIYLLCRRVTLPLKRVAHGMVRVKAGDYRVQLPEVGSDEIGMLTISFNEMARRLDEAHTALLRYQRIQQSTAFYALQQQVNPHMLFNTLDMIIGMATRKDFEAIVSACSCLAAMFRYSLSRDLTVPLGQELKHIKNYLEILSLRSAGRIQGEFALSDREAGVPIPKLSLQPFVENSVKHAFDRKESDCKISIRVERKRDFLTATIRDNGCGFPEKVLSELKDAIRAPFSDEVPDQHIGILNVCRRMSQIYGEDFSIGLRNLPEGGAEVTLRFPPDFPKNVI